MDINEAKKLVIKAGINLVESGLIARTWGNVSCRIDRNSFVITPSGRDYRTLTPDEIVQVNIADLSYSGNIKPSSENGMHAAIYKLYPHTNFIIHTHQDNASVIAASDINSLKVKSGYTSLRGEVICAKYALPGTRALWRNVTDALVNSEANAVIMKYHGALCLGEDYDEAFMIASELEKACQDLIEDQYLKLSKRNKFNISEMCTFALSFTGDQNENDIIMHDCGKKIIIKRSEITSFSAEERKICEGIFSSNKNVNFIISDDSPEMLAISQAVAEFKPILDDFAQIAGTHVKSVDNNPELISKALKKSPVVLIRAKGALCCGETCDDAEAVRMVTEKACKAFIGASLFGKIKPIKPLECKLMRFVYLNKYSKKANKK